MNSKIRLTIMFIIIILLPKLFCQVQQNYTVEHIGINDGLPDPKVTCFLKDTFGYLWIGTFNGVCRYDGYKFKVYLQGDPNIFIQCIFEDKSGTIWVGTGRGLNKYSWTKDSFKTYDIPADTTGLKTSFEPPGIRAMYEDKKGNFWIGTRNSLYTFNKEKENFTLFKSSIKQPNELSGKSIGVIYQDKTGNLWFGSGDYDRIDGGLYLLDPSTGIIKQFVHDPSNPKSLIQNWVTAIYQDKLGNLWIGTDGGLDKFDFARQTFFHFRHDNYNKNSLTSSAIKCILEDNEGNIIIGTWAGGLNKYNPQSGKFSVFSLNNNEEGNKKIYNVISIYKDSSGTLWIGTFKNGMFKMTPYPKSIIRSQNSVKNSEEIRDKLKRSDITALYRDNKGVIWIGTNNEGVHSINPDLTFGHSYLNNLPAPDNSVFSVYKDKTNKLWVGTVGGLYTVDLNTKKVTRYIHEANNPKTISDNQITSIVEDSSGNIWLGTFSHGIEKYNRKKNIFKHFSLGSPSYLSHHRVYMAVFKLFIDSYGYLWIASYKGLARLNLSNESIKWYLPHSNIVSSPWYYYVLGILEDHDGKIWLATPQGLVRFNRESDTFTLYGKADNLADERIGSLLEDKHGNIWLGTFTGISMFDPLTKQFKNFRKNYGLNIGMYYTAPACKDLSGNFYFANSDSGIVVFNPDSIYSDYKAPPIVLTDFIFSDKSAQLDSSITIKKNIELNYRQNEFSIEFSALDFINSNQNQYAYKLEGYDKNWIYCGDRHQVTYMNLNYGTYVFRVIGSNSDDVWNQKGASLIITIFPPWWRTTWAYISYGLFFVFGLFGFRKYELNRVHLKDKIKLDEAVLKERVETDKIKSRFFANISHEFRTPLTLILSPAEKIMSGSSNDVRKDAGIIKKNSRRLLQLVNQLLDLSRLEAGKLKLETSKNNIVSFVKGIALSFESLSEEKDITLKIFSEKEYIEVYFDKEKMIKVISNILLNAFKFTSNNGKITILLRNNDKYAEIKIRDTGIGIPQEEIPKLFDRFYQVDSSFKKEHQGTGIGLALAKELVELHHGSISVESEIGQWTEFLVYLPLGKEHLKNEEIVEETRVKWDAILNEKDNLFLPDIVEDYKNINLLNEVVTDEDKTIILIVEDNFDMREYIKEILDKDYLVEEAVNGEQGVRKAEMIIPDLIISDMMMPKMDGNELTRILKNNEKTSHIPIIILTAKSGQENKLEGLETGADDYLTKPFDLKELQVRIKNLINLRKKLQEKLGKIDMSPTTAKENNTLPNQSIPVKLRSVDERFLAKIKEIVTEHISEEGFSTEELGRKLGMSYSQVFRKIKALTGKSPSLFVRSIRLLKAKAMIENGDGNISEIAYSVGFSSAVYFSKCFKEEFGYSPKNFLG